MVISEREIDLEGNKKDFNKKNVSTCKNDSNHDNRTKEERFVNNLEASSMFASVNGKNEKITHENKIKNKIKNNLEKIFEKNKKRNCTASAPPKGYGVEDMRHGDDKKGYFFCGFTIDHNPPLFEKNFCLKFHFKIQALFSK